MPRPGKGSGDTDRLAVSVPTPPKLPRGSQGRGWVRVRGAWPLPPALYRRDHDVTLRVCLSSDKRTPLGPRTPAHLEFDFHNLILEGKRAGSHVPAPALGEAASDGRSGKPRGYARVSVSGVRTTYENSRCCAHGSPPSTSPLPPRGTCVQPTFSKHVICYKPHRM